MGKAITTIFICIILITIPDLIAQNLQLSFENPTISAGAEYSLFLRKMINSRNSELVKFKGSKESLNKQNLVEVITTIEGINFDEDAVNSGFYHIPPDPIGAAGPDHIISVVNTSVEWFTKIGVNQHSESLESFFSSLSPLTGTFDPKVIYDQYNDRFVVLTLEQTDVTTGDPSNTSRIFISVSQTSNPNDGWYFAQINSKVNISGIDTWPDYPGFAIGTDAIYITCNLFSFGSSPGFFGSREWIIAKSPYYSGGVMTVNLYDPSTEAGLSSQNFTMQPAHMFGIPPSGVFSYLVASGWSSGATDYLSVITIGGTLVSPTFSNTFVSLNNIHNNGVLFPSDAPQSGTTKTILANDSRMLNAVWRNNNLWTVNTVNPPTGTDAGEATAHWYKINTIATPSLTDQGNIGGETIAANCYTFFPSITVNSNDDVCIGFSASASTIYPGCYFTGRISTDPPGTTIIPGVIKTGLDYYVRTFTSGSLGRNRWGDYSGACVDPSDDQTFYVFNEYALTRGTPISGEMGRWGTTFGVVPVTALPVELSSFTASVEENGIKLYWRTETEVQNYGFEIERLQDYKIKELQDWNTIRFVEGYGNSNSPKEYSFLDKEINYGKYAYLLKQIDSDGNFEYSNIIEVDVGNFPGEFVLEQNYPNPFNPKTKIKFGVKSSQQIMLNVYDILGNLAAELFNGKADAKRIYDIEFNGSSLSSGIYFYRLESDSFIKSGKMLLLK